MKYFTNFILLMFLIIWGCENPMIPGLPPSDFQEKLNNVEINQIDYFTILFKSADNFQINSVDVDKLIFGYYNEESFISLDTIEILHTSSSSYLNFSDTITFAYSFLNVTVGLKYILKNYSPFTIKKKFSLFSFPYETSKIICKYESFLPNNDIQDFVYRFPILYYHPYGAEGLFKQNFSTGENNLLIDYPGGDFLDGNSNCIFIDLHIRIERYNLNTNLVDAEISLVDSFPGINIQGLAANDTSLFVITVLPQKLFILNNNLEIQKSIDFPTANLYSMTYYNGYLYSLRLENNHYHIIKFDSDTGTIVNENKTPTLYTGTVKILEGVLYFTDSKQKVLGYTWLDDIFAPED